MSKRSSKKGAADKNRRILKLNTVKFGRELPEGNSTALQLDASNVRRWDKLKLQCACKTNDEFVTVLLDIAEEHFNKKASARSLNNASSKTTASPQVEENAASPSVRRKVPEKKKKITLKDHDSKVKTKKTKNLKTASNNNNNNNNISKKLAKTAKIKQEPEVEDIQEPNTNYDDPKLEESNHPNANISPKTQKHYETESYLTDDSILKKYKSNIRGKKKTNTNSCDIRSVPEFDISQDIKQEIVQKSFVESDVDAPPIESHRVAIKIKMCHSCNSRHMQDNCPLQNPLRLINDPLSFTDWSLDVQPNIDQTSLSFNDENEENKIDLAYIQKYYKTSYALVSLPQTLYLKNVDVEHGPSVFTNVQVEEFTQFGPIVGKVVKEVDIPEDFSMKYIWQIYSTKSQIYINNEDLFDSNWIRFVRPAPNREGRNVLAVSRSDKLYLVTTRIINPGEELLYWQDDGISNQRKKMEKLNCGGCNITFLHPLYYRMHCFIFHDVRYSLTIRKYHCKICGAAVLGKENIMKHAADLHNGEGAYQCQFCKKFFLRLNYLEMHRTYGCSANPHRSRPLCDFCGRKFCQPQKLKVHIKRMHSDMSEVLKEFQCKNCLKLLGSRAALQRHLKEVHHKQVDGSFSCKRCGKLFQNKSNLKIHMLTHSGIKPFKCREDNCAAAFTTKQCLQFHYKKVHGFAEDIMPKIERSIEYTFEAYSGLEEDNEEGQINIDEATTSQQSKRTMSLDESTDADDISLSDKNMDEEPPALHSPIPIASEQSSRSNPSPPLLEAYTNLPPVDVRILSKGSKKWLGEEPQQMLLLPHETIRKDLYSIENDQQKGSEDGTNIIIDVNESQTFDRNKLAMNLNVFSRHESTNASLLVEAALDSVSDIQITNTDGNIGSMDISNTGNCDDTLVNNLYPLPPSTLPSMNYNGQSMGESRDLNLLSPSVNDHISVTDDLNDAPPISMDYTLHHDDFSQTNSPTVQSRSNFIRDYLPPSSISPSHTRRMEYNVMNGSDVASAGNSPPYDIGNSGNGDNLSSDDSNGISAQNLSLHGAKEEVQLDLSLYKSHYNIDSGNFFVRRNLRSLSKSQEKKHTYPMSIEDAVELHGENKSPSDQDQMDPNNSEVNDCGDEHKHNVDSNFSDLDARNKQIDLDIDIRTKNYDIIENDLRNRNLYDTSDIDFRSKPYDLVDAMDSRNKAYDAILESDFRMDRNFEPLILNSSELQGLDMSARTYHNFHTTNAVSSLNRFHHIYSEVDRPTVDLRLSYSPPPPSYPDVLRAVSLDLTPPGRHSVDLSLRSHSFHAHQLAGLQANRILTDNNRLPLDHNRLLAPEHSIQRHLSPDGRMMGESGNRLLSDHTTNRILSSDQITSRLLTAEPGRLLSEDGRLLEQGRLLNDTRVMSQTGNSGGLSPPYTNYSVSPNPFHPNTLSARPTHTTSPTASTYHHYSAYY